jgi:hypothetical protein
MMTTSRVFNIASAPTGYAAPPVDTYTASAAPPDNSAEKFRLLSEALQSFIDKKITKNELTIVQNSLSAL